MNNSRLLIERQIVDTARRYGGLSVWPDGNASIRGSSKSGWRVTAACRQKYLVIPVFLPRKCFIKPNPTLAVEGIQDTILGERSAKLFEPLDPITFVEYIGAEIGLTNADSPTCLRATILE